MFNISGRKDIRKLEYAAVVWSQHTKDIKKLERIQTTATKMVPELRELEYEDRLKETGLPTLQDRKERGYLIMMYKTVNEKEKIDRTDLIFLGGGGTRPRHTRGHSRKIGESMLGRCQEV